MYVKRGGGGRKYMYLLYRMVLEDTRLTTRPSVNTKYRVRQMSFDLPENAS